MVSLKGLQTEPQVIAIPTFPNRKAFNRWYVEIYLKSPHWVAFALMLKMMFPWCEDCSSSNVPLETHHETYVNLGNETHKDCRNLCVTCHRKIHRQLQQLGFVTERDYMIWVKVKKNRNRRKL